jgi:hypothetical protein
MGEIEHDIFSHGKRSHRYNVYDQNNFKKHNFRMNQFIQLLKPYFDYDEKDASLYIEMENNEQTLVITTEKQENNIIMSANQQKVCYCLLLFMMIHEMNFGYVYTFIQNYLHNYTTLDDFFTELDTSQTQHTRKLYRLTDIYKENDENKAIEKFKFLKHIDYKNVFINFIRLLFSLKEDINQIESDIF